MELVCLTMAVIEIFSEPELRKYRASIVTKAFLVRAICVLLIFIPPVLIVYASGGMYVRCISPDKY
jgi:Transmembrane protein 231